MHLIPRANRDTEGYHARHENILNKTETLFQLAIDLKMRQHSPGNATSFPAGCISFLRVISFNAPLRVSIHFPLDVCPRLDELNSNSLESSNLTCMNANVKSSYSRGRERESGVRETEIFKRSSLNLNWNLEKRKLRFELLHVLAQIGPNKKAKNGTELLNNGQLYVRIKFRYS